MAELTDGAAKILNAFSVDLEDWFCVGNMERLFPPPAWDGLEIRLDRPVSVLLGLLEKHGVRATFFVLGWIAERRPGMVREIYAAGHEIGLHGHVHRRVTSMGRAGFEDDLRRSMDAVCAAGVPREAVAGYRAPSFSVVERTAWALESLAAFGMKYDSSVVPFTGHPDYGWNAPAAIHRPASAPGLVEVPLTPGFGGGYFRLFPYALTRRIGERANRLGRPAVFYVHPWELDPEQPRVELPPTKRFRHYIGLKRTLPRLERLLSDFRFGAIGDVLSENGF